MGNRLKVYSYSLNVFFPKCLSYFWRSIIESYYLECSNGRQFSIVPQCQQLWFSVRGGVGSICRLLRELRHSPASFFHIRNLRHWRNTIFGQKSCAGIPNLAFDVYILVFLLARGSGGYPRVFWQDDVTGTHRQHRRQHTHTYTHSLTHTHPTANLYMQVPWKSFMNGINMGGFH